MREIVYMLSALLITLIDFLVKRSIIIYVKGASEISLLGGILKIVYSENKGAAFGIFNNNKYFLIIVSGLATILLLCLLFSRKVNNKIFFISCTFAIGGGIGNLLDRFIYGYVIDYIKLSFFPPVCNLSDYFITIGMVGIMFCIAFLGDKKSEINIIGSNK